MGSWVHGPLLLMVDGWLSWLVDFWLILDDLMSTVDGFDGVSCLRYVVFNGVAPLVAVDGWFVDFGA